MTVFTQCTVLFCFVLQKEEVILDGTYRFDLSYRRSPTSSMSSQNENKFREFKPKGPMDVFTTA